MRSPVFLALRSTRSALHLAALLLCAVLLLPGLLGLPAHAAPAVSVPANNLSRSPALADQLPNGTLIRDTVSGRMYVVWAMQRHWIDSPATFRELAYAASTVINLDPEQVAALPNGTALSLHLVAGGLVWPWAPIQATPILLNLAQPSATAGGSLPVTASGFRPGEAVTFTAPNGIVFTSLADGQGALTVTVPIPSTVGSGQHQVYAQGGQSGLFGVQVFHVIAPAPAPSLSVTPNPVASGTNLSVSGSGFMPAEQAQIFLNGGTSTAVVSSNAAGGFGPVQVPVPGNLHPGAYAVQVYGAGSGRSTSSQVAVVVSQPAVPTATLVPLPPANPVVIVSPAITSPGSQVVMSGSGFGPSEIVLIRFNGQLEDGATVNSAGNFAGVLVTVPSGTGSGTYPITATGASTQRVARTALIVQAPPPVPVASIAISPLIALPGTQVLVAGTGFQPGELVLVSFHGALVQNRTADASGSFTNGGFIVPNTLPPGQYGVLVVGATSGRRASAALTVHARPAVIAARLTVNPSTIAPGGHTALVGSGFIPGEQVLLRFDNALVQRVTADRSGAFSDTVTVHAALGTHTLTASGATSRRVAAATLRVLRPVTASMGLVPNTAHRGNVVRVNGKNFLPGEVVLIRLGSTLVQAATADKNGNFSNASFTVPGTARYGLTYVNITGSRSGRSAKAALQITPAPPVGAHLTLSSTNLHRGSKVTVSGSGYQAGEIVLIRFRGGLVQAATAGKKGKFSKASFQVPMNSPYGTFSVTVTGEHSGRSASVKVRVTPTPPRIGISVSAITVKRNGSLTVSGHGFLAGEIVVLRLNGQVVQAAKVDAHGNFGRISFRIQPSARVGKATLLATGARSGRHAQLTIVIV